jgi:hypothetical protein
MTIHHDDFLPTWSQEYLIWINRDDLSPAGPAARQSGAPVSFAWKRAQRAKTVYHQGPNRALSERVLLERP